MTDKAFSVRGVLVLIISILCAFVVYKFIKHEKYQSEQLAMISNKEAYLEEKLKQVTDYYNYDTQYKDNTYNYLAIGNSLTKITSWDRGICSTQPDNDYFHLVKSDLQKTYGEVTAYAYNFSVWERSSSRDTTLDLIDVYLNEKLDLVTLQLGENAADLSNYKEDMINLIEYIKEKAPKATIILIGEFWNVEKNVLREQAAMDEGIKFADISEIIGEKEYQSKTGTTCYLEDGSTVKVSKEAAAHPGDKGMKYIADAIISQIPSKQ